MNWTTLTIDDLTAVNAGLAGAAQAQVEEAIGDAAAAVRGAVSTGNTLDRDAATVPRSLRALAARTAAFALMERLRFELSAEQQAARTADAARLAAVGSQRQRCEPADHPAGPSWETVEPGEAGNGRRELRGL